MDKSSKGTQEQQKVSMTCPCGEPGQKNLTAQLKTGQKQAYCSEECMDLDKSKQVPQQQQQQQKPR